MLVGKLGRGGERVGIEVAEIRVVVGGRHAVFVAGLGRDEEKGGAIQAGNLSWRHVLLRRLLPLVLLLLLVVGLRVDVTGWRHVEA